MKRFISTMAVALFFTHAAFANAKQVLHLAPQPTSCIASEFKSTGDKYWKNMVLRISNRCTKAMDFQNASITFQHRTALNTNFWGNFSPLPYPDNDLRISSQALPGGNFLATLKLHFPTYPGANSFLPVGSTFEIKYGLPADEHIEGTTQVYLGETGVSGNIELSNLSSKPADVSSGFALVHVSMNGQNVSDVQLPWNGTQLLPNLAVGTYAIAADNVMGTSGNTYQGSATPASVSVLANQTAKVAISYRLVEALAKISIELQTLPAELGGYTGKPTVLLTEEGTGSTHPLMVDWGTTAVASQLKAGSTYRFSTSSIDFNGFQCAPTFTPSTLIASETAPITKLTYSCSQVAQSKATLNVSGAPTTLATLKVTLTPNNNTAPVSQIVNLINGSGTQSVMLVTGVIYQVSADPVPNYTISFSPQPLTASDGVVETILLTASSGGTPVSINGRLKVCGTKLCNQHGVPIQLKGMSTHGLQWYGWGKCVTTASIDAMVNDFKSNVIRISLYVQEGGYETDPVGFTNQVNLIIEEATKRGIYAIVDWHMLTPGDPNFNLTRAQKFFTDIATAHKGKVNLLYEIANEPNGVSWATIKSYAEKLIPVIRAIDPDTVILVGTRAWSSLGLSDGANSQEIINAPVAFPNLMYTFHFYAASHRDFYLNELDKASNLLPIFVSEFGTQTFTGDGADDFVMADRYMQLMKTKQIGWTNWNYSDDFRSGAIWKVGTCPNGPWTSAQLKPAGVYIRDKIIN